MFWFMLLTGLAETSPFEMRLQSIGPSVDNSRVVFHDMVSQ